MPLAAIATLIGVALTVAALAYYLIHVILLLRRTHFNLGTIIAGLRAIAHQTAPLDELVGDINRDLGQVQDLLEGLLADKLGVDALEGDEPIEV